MSKTSRPVRFALGLALAGALQACYVVPVGHGRGGPPPGEVVAVPPPPPYDEVIPAAPAVGHVWIGGHWTWRLGRHVWIGGRWALPPHGHHWVPHRWERGPRGWTPHHGYWAPRRG